jgi:hypothetical protein
MVTSDPCRDATATCSHTAGAVRCSSPAVAEVDDGRGAVVRACARHAAEVLVTSDRAHVVTFTRRDPAAPAGEPSRLPRPRG